MEKRSKEETAGENLVVEKCAREVGRLVVGHGPSDGQVIKPGVNWARVDSFPRCTANEERDISVVLVSKWVDS